MVRSLRFAVLVLGFAAGPLLVHALDRGLAGAPRAFTAGHLLLGLVVAAAAQPGPLLGLVLTEESGERARGVAVGGSVVTALTALFAGALLARRVFVLGEGGVTEWTTLAWAAGALPLAALDAL